VHGTFGIDQPKPLDMFIIRKIEDSIQIIKNFIYIRGFGHPDYDGLYIDQISDFFAEIMIGSRGFGHPYQISDFFAEIMIGSHGFGHPCHDGLSQIDISYIFTKYRSFQKIQNDEKFPPSVAPVININGFNAEEWKTYNENILERKRQTKIDLDWTEVYSKFIMFKSIYDSIKTQKFVAENLKTKEINKMIKQSIPESMVSEISKLRKVYEFTVIVIENENINLENFLVKIRDLNITLNSLQNINRDDFLTLFTAIIEKK
ncbi:30091_t:CDS:2, partial [Gigaspora margarita]